MVCFAPRGNWLVEGASALPWPSKRNESALKPRDHRSHLHLAHAAPRCGARRKRDGQPCQGPAMANGRCRVHGGKSTGPRTPEGLERSRKAAWKHGHYTAEAKAARQKARQQSRLMRQIMDELMEDGADFARIMLKHRMTSD
jgi:hypothetical protein